MKYIELIFCLILGVTLGCTSSEPVAKSGSVVRASAFGAKADGRGDDAAALQAALNALPPSGGKLILEPGTYLLGKGLQLLDRKEFTLVGYGATLKAKKGLPKHPVNALLTLDGCERFRVVGLSLDGNREQRPAEPNQIPCHNLRILDVRYADFDSVTSINAMQDGFTLQDKPRLPDDVHHVRFRNCFALNNYRQGLSIINGRQVEVLGGEYSGTRGVVPEAGIDVEANKGEAPNLNITIRGVTFENNYGYGIALGGPETGSRQIRIDSCFFRGNGAGGVLVTLDDTEISRSVFEGNSKIYQAGSDWYRGNALIDAKHAEVNNLLIRDNTFRNTTVRMFGLWLSSGVQNVAVIHNMFEQMPQASIAVYAGQAKIIGNTFADGRGRDIQFKKGAGHMVACNRFLGSDRPLMLVETPGTYSTGNTFNEGELPKRLLQRADNLQEFAPAAPTRERSTSSASKAYAPVRGRVAVTSERSLRVDATNPVSISLPAEPEENTVVISRVAGDETITLAARDGRFADGSASLQLTSERKVAVCFFDGIHWRVY